MKDLGAPVAQLDRATYLLSRRLPVQIGPGAPFYTEKFCPIFGATSITFTQLSLVFAECTMRLNHNLLKLVTLLDNNPEL